MSPLVGKEKQLSGLQKESNVNHATNAEELQVPVMFCYHHPFPG